MIERFVDEYRWLSNFTPVEVWLDGELYHSVEHAYVAAKTFNKDIRKEIQYLPTAGAAKKFGRLMVVRHDWNEVKVPVMTNLLRQKFSEPELAKKLIGTRNEGIVEGNSWHDNFWGSCQCENCGNKGLNTLGKLLMSIRESLVQLPLDFSGESV